MRLSQRRGEGFLLFKSQCRGFLYVSTSLDQEGTIILLQPDVGVDSDEEITTTSEQAAACEEFARPSKKRQQQGITARSTGKNKRFDAGG